MKKVKDLKQKKDAIWAKWEREAGFPLAQPFRNAVEKQAGPYLGYDEDNWLIDLDGSILSAIEIVNSARPTSPTVSVPKGEPKKRYSKPFERRFHLVKFVVERLVRSSKVRYGVEDKRDIEKWLRLRFNWQLIANEWNVAYPFERIKPEVLRVEYYRAVQDDNLVYQLIITKRIEWATNEICELMVNELLDQHMNNPPEGMVANKAKWEKDRVFIKEIVAKEIQAPIKMVKKVSENDLYIEPYDYANDWALFYCWLFFKRPPFTSLSPSNDKRFSKKGKTLEERVRLTKKWEMGIKRDEERIENTERLIESLNAGLEKKELEVDLRLNKIIDNILRATKGVAYLFPKKEAS